MKRLVRILAVGGVLAATAAVTTAPASGAVGTWTKITAPKGPGQPIYRLDNDNAALPTWSVSGVTSTDLVAGVDTINVFCFTNGDNFTTSDAALNASPLTINSNHTFSGV